MELQTHGVRKYPTTSALLASSAGLGWSTISAELRFHGVSEVPPVVPQHVQIVEQAVMATGSLDDAKLAQFTRDHSFKTILGELKFGAGGGWSEARVLQVQYRDIKGNELSNFRDAATQAVVWPPSLASADLIYPHAKARQNS